MFDPSVAPSILLGVTDADLRIFAPAFQYALVDLALAAPESRLKKTIRSLFGGGKRKHA